MSNAGKNPILSLAAAIKKRERQAWGATNRRLGKGQAISEADAGIYGEVDMGLCMLIACTDHATRFVPQDVALAAGAKGPGLQHWRVMKRIMQWAEWMDRCEGLRP